MNILPEQEQAMQQALANQDKDAVFEIASQMFAPQEAMQTEQPQESSVKMDWSNYKK